MKAPPVKDSLSSQEMMDGKCNKMGKDQQKDLFSSYQQQEVKLSSSKTRELENMHRMNDDWFDPNSSMDFFPPNQMVWDATNQCYEEFQVLQCLEEPFESSWPEFSASPTQLMNDVDPYTSFAPTAFPLVDFLGGVIMDFVDTLYNSNLVQYVSPHRLAAEILAKSNLNPNAKEFTPITKGFDRKINAMETKEFSPSAREFVPETNYPFVAENCSEELIIEEESLLTEEQLVPERNVIEEVVQVKDNIKVENNSEDAKLSNSSGDNSKCDKDEDEGVDDDWDDDESEDWWDSDEEPGSQGQEIDPSEFEDLFPCGLLVSNLPCHSSSKISTTLTCKPSTTLTCKPSTTLTCKPSMEIDPSPSSNFTSVACIMLTCNPVQPNKRLDRINKKFNQTFPDEGVKKSAAIVKFSDNIKVVEEPEELAEDLAEARISDWPKRQVDKERMERLLAPVFTRTHREKIFSQLYRGEL